MNRSEYLQEAFEEAMFELMETYLNYLTCHTTDGHPQCLYWGEFY